MATARQQVLVRRAPRKGRRTAVRARQKRASKELPVIRWGLLAGLALLLAWCFHEYRSLPRVGDLLHRNPKTTALIEQRIQEARDAGRRPRKRQKWVGLAQVARPAVDAVLLSEDAAFFQHDGVDTREMKRALEDAWEKRSLGRGASTLTMQLAKNLWLSTDRSLLRKLKELVLTARLEEALPKKRILTLYLNVAEWGDGVYGIEAGAQEHFGVRASELTTAQAVVLASMLPAPRKWSVQGRSPRLRARALRLIQEMVRTGRISAGEASQARAEVAEMFGEDVALDEA